MMSEMRLLLGDQIPMVQQILDGAGLQTVTAKKGDTKIIWDPDNKEEVNSAKRTFEDLRKKGFTAFSVKKDGSRDTLVTEFDEDLEKLILVPRITGG